MAFKCGWGLYQNRGKGKGHISTARIKGMRSFDNYLSRYDVLGRPWRGCRGVHVLTGPDGMSCDVGEDTDDTKIRQLRDPALWGEAW